MIDSTIVIEKAKSWRGTKWQHNQRVKGVGVDCINFLYAVAIESGIEIEPIPESYGRLPIFGEIEAYLDRNFTTADDIEPCCILLFNWSGYGCHVALATPNNRMIHANQKIGEVVEHHIDGIWIRSLKKIYKHESIIVI